MSAATGGSPRRSGLAAGFVAVCDSLSKASAVLAGFALIAGVLAVCHMITMRYALGESTIWQTEFVIFSVTGSMLLGAPYVLLTNGHVAITVLPDAMTGIVRRAMRATSSLVGFGFCLALAYGCVLYLEDAFVNDWTTGSAWNPVLWPALLPVAAGAVLLALQYLAEIVRGEPDSPEIKTTTATPKEGPNNGSSY